jgi:hypothetical protein
MKAVAFDTHLYVKRLKAVGFTEEQAEAQAEVLAEIVEDKLATKLDLKELEITLRRELAEIKADIIKWVAGMLVAQAAVIAALVKLL